MHWSVVGLRFKDDSSNAGTGEFAGGKRGAGGALDEVDELVADGKRGAERSPANEDTKRLRTATARPMRVPGLIGATGASGLFGATGVCRVVSRVVGTEQAAGGERGADGVLKAVAERVGEGECSVERSAAGGGTERLRAATARPLIRPMIPRGLIGGTGATGLFGATEVRGLVGATGIRSVLSRVLGSVC